MPTSTPARRLPLTSPRPRSTFFARVGITGVGSLPQGFTTKGRLLDHHDRDVFKKPLVDAPNIPVKRFNNQPGHLRIDLHADGHLVVDNDIVFAEADMTDLPRIGVRLDFVVGYERLSFSEATPSSTTPDCKAGRLVARHKTTVTPGYEEYVMTQEHGHHPDVR